MSKMSYSLSSTRQLPEEAVFRVHNETQSTLGDSWEVVGEAAQPTANHSSTFLTRRKEVSKDERSDLISRLSAHAAAENLRVPQKSNEIDPECTHSAIRSKAPSKCVPRVSNELSEISACAELALDDYLECYCRVQASIEQIFEQLCECLQHSDTKAVPARDLLQRIANDRDSLTSRSATVKEASLKRTALKDIFQQEKRIEISGSDICPIIEPFGHRDQSEASSVSEVPAMVEEYFEAAGEAFVEYERLEDLENRHEELVATLEESGEEHESLSVSISEYEDEYRRKKLELGGALAIAHYRLDVQREACLAQGIDPEHYRYRRLSNPPRPPRPKSSRQ